LLSKYENFTPEGRGKFEGYVSFGEARGEGEHRGFLELRNYKIPSMILLLIASQDYILIPYQKDGKWGFADTNGKIVIPPEYDAVGVYRYSGQLIGIPILTELQGFLIPQAPVKPKFSLTDLSWVSIDSIRIYFMVLELSKSFVDFIDINTIIKNSLVEVASRVSIDVSDFIGVIIGSKPIKNGPVWVMKDGKFGLFDISGKELVSPKYEEVLPFERGRSWVKLNGKWGLIDDKGKELTPIKYDGAIISDEGIIWVREEGKWVIIDENGKELSSNRYDYDAVTPFTEGVSWVLKGNKWGLVNKNGKEIISPKYEGVCPFVGGLSAVMVGEKWGTIDKSGKEIIPVKYDGIGVYKPQGNNYPFKDIPCDDLEDLVREGLIAIKVGDKYGFVDKSGKVVISPKYDAVIPFVGGIAAVKRDGKWGFVDKTGKEIVPPTYEYPVIDYNYLKMGYLPVVEKAGKYSTPFGGEYDFLVHVDSNLFLAKKDDKWGLIDKKNREVLSFKYDDLSHLHKDFFVYSERGKYGVISLKRGVIVQPRYDKIFYAGEGIIGLVLNNKVGFMDTLGNIIFQPKYDTLTLGFINGFALMYNKGKPYILSKDGKEMEIKYSDWLVLGGSVPLHLRGWLVHLGGGVLLHLHDRIYEIFEINKVLEGFKNLKKIKQGVFVDERVGAEVKESDILRTLSEEFPNIPELKKAKRIEDAINLLTQRKASLMKKIFYFKVLPDGRIIEFRG
jgi:hypothetical protein